MPYTLDDLDNAIANSIGPRAWEAVGAGTPGFCRPILMNNAAVQRWFSQSGEDDDSRVLREAYGDLCNGGCLKPSDGWDADEGDRKSWE